MDSSLRWLLRGLSILVGAAAVLSGARAIHYEAPIFASVPVPSMSPRFREQMKAVTERLPAGAFVLHLSAVQEGWYSKLWQRMLFPRNETILIEPPLNPDILKAVRAKYGVRFAISQGNPPYDPGYLWKINLGTLPQFRGESWFGELAP